MNTDYQSIMRKKDIAVNGKEICRILATGKDGGYFVADMAKVSKKLVNVRSFDERDLAEGYYKGDN